LLRTNYSGDAQLVDVNNFNYRLTAGSPAIDAGTQPGSANGYVLKPSYEYVQPACGETRMQIGKIDIGAYEFGGSGILLVCR
jgi:hypothetical protein